MRELQAKISEYWDNYLHVVQIKYGQRIKISLGLGLPEIGMTFGDVIEQCRKRGIVGAKHIIHQTSRATRSKPGDQLGKQTISRSFSAIRDKVLNEDDWAGQTTPSYHEIRALSKMLYKRLGVDIMDLLGHDDEEMDALYSDPRTGWRIVEAVPAKT